MRNYAVISLILLVAAMLPNGSKAQDIDWEAAIETVEQSALSYSDYAFSELGSRWVGPANYSIRFNTHRCAILGRMLGLPEAIQHIETFDYPPLDASSDAFDLLVFSLTLENWVAAARASLEMNRDERVNVWNLDCVGEVGIAANLFIESGQPNATFEVKGRTLVVYGDIDAGFFERLKNLLEANPNIEEVALGSGGGSVRDAVLAGYEIRRLGLSTTLYGNCFSACPLIFMGGVERVLWAGSHRLGFHQIYIGDGNAISADDPAYDITRQYLTEMGVNAQVVISWMHSARPSEMFEPAVSDLCAPRVSTFVQRICGF
jgi:hypothetical protein